MKKLMLPMCLLAASVLCASPALAEKYYTYCSNGKVEIDTRDLQKMKSARGGNVYLLGESNFRTDAEKVAKKFGGVGKQCPKK